MIVKPRLQGEQRDLTGRIARQKNLSPIIAQHTPIDSEGGPIGEDLEQPRSG